VATIYLEKWAYNLLGDEIQELTNEYCKGDQKRLQIWPVIDNITDLSADTNKLLQ